MPKKLKSEGSSSSSPSSYSEDEVVEYAKKTFAAHESDEDIEYDTDHDELFKEANKNPEKIEGQLSHLFK